jgi:hypothetical protein
MIVVEVASLKQQPVREDGETPSRPALAASILLTDTSYAENTKSAALVHAPYIQAALGILDATWGMDSAAIVNEEIIASP